MNFPARSNTIYRLNIMPLERINPFPRYIDRLEVRKTTGTILSGPHAAARRPGSVECTVMVKTTSSNANGRNHNSTLSDSYEHDPGVIPGHSHPSSFVPTNCNGSPSGS